MALAPDREAWRNRQLLLIEHLGEIARGLRRASDVVMEMDKVEPAFRRETRLIAQGIMAANRATRDLIDLMETRLHLSAEEHESPPT